MTTIYRVLILCIIFSFSCQNAKEVLTIENPIETELINAEEVFDGYLLWHQADELKEDVNNITLLLDPKGDIAHIWNTDLSGMGAPAYLLENGLLLRTGFKDPKVKGSGPVASTNIVQLVDAESQVVWEWEHQNLKEEKMFFHHDMEPLPNGNFLLSTYKAIPASEAKAMGWNTLGKNKVWSDGIIEIKPDIENNTYDIVWEWNFADHLIQDQFPNANNFGIVSENVGKINSNYPKKYPPRGDVRQHINSIDYNPDLDQIILSSFIYNEIWIIDHSTTRSEAEGSKGGKSGKGGDLLYRYGNPEAYGMGTIKDRKFLKQHDANWIDSDLPGTGNVLVHNNNTVFNPGMRAQEGRLSSVFELQLPVEASGSYQRTEGKPYDALVQLKWEHPDYFADFQGGAQRLPNGNTLITDTVDRLVLQINSEGQIIAKYIGDAPVYKAFMYTREFVEHALKL